MGENKNKKKLPLSHKGSKNLEEYLSEALCFRVLVAKKTNVKVVLYLFKLLEIHKLDLKEFFSDLK